MKKWRVIHKIKALYDQGNGISKSAIARKHGISRNTVRKYLRLAGAIGGRWATVAVACLFAAGHIPAMMSQGATWIEISGLLRDAALGVVVILTLRRSRDIVRQTRLGTGLSASGASHRSQVRGINF